MPIKESKEDLLKSEIIESLIKCKKRVNRLDQNNLITPIKITCSIGNTRKVIPRVCKNTHQNKTKEDSPPNTSYLREIETQ